MERGEEYSIEFFVLNGEGSGSFEIELVEMNRESLALTDNEYLLDLRYVGERYFEGGGRDCDIYSQPADSSKKYAEEYSHQVILDLSLGYQRQLYADTGNEYGDISRGTLYFDKDEPYYIWQEIFHIDSDTGLVLGSYYKKEIEPDLIGGPMGLGTCPRNIMYRISDGFVTGEIIL